MAETKSDTYTLYVHTCIANHKVYVGITYKDANDRWKDGEGYKSNFELYSDIRKYGWEDGFFHQIVRDDLSWEKVKEAEAYFVNIFDSTNPEKGYNHTIGGLYGKKRERGDFGSKLKTLRKNKGITQDELSKSLDITRSTISNYEIGRRSPNLDELKRIADYFGVGLDYFSSKGLDASFEISTRVLEFFKSEEYTEEQKVSLFNDIIGFYSRFVLNND